MANEETPLDAAFAAQERNPGDAAARLRFHERVLDAELTLALVAEPEGTAIDPQVFDLSDGRFVLAFDRDDRMAAFLDAPVPFAAMSGRTLSAMLAGRDLGIALNLGAPSATLLPAEAVAWLAEMAAGTPEATAARIVSLAPPAALPPGLAEGLGAKLAAMAGVVGTAWLAAATLAGGDRRLVLGLAGVPDAARAGVSAAVAEAVRFGTEDATVDLVFVEAGSPLAASLARNGARLDLPAPPEPAPQPGPGLDPSRPPRLR